MSRLFRAKEERRTLWQRIVDVALTDVGVLVRGIDHDALEDLEALLIAADFGPPATLRLVDRMEALLREGRVRTQDDLRAAVSAEIMAILGPVPPEPERGSPHVVLVVGVNGVGKTTTIGKLAHALRAEGRSVLLAAGDTFRAGAIEQIGLWASRSGADFVGAEAGADPAAVAFDAVDAALARGADTVIVDTAGRLHTQGDLMAELAKVARVLDKRLPGAPHEVLMVLDATVGQNALAQVRTFSGSVPLTGLVLTKMDGSARGGAVIALREETDVPIRWAGTGERMGDLSPFDPEAFVRQVLGEGT
ncbi:MAG: signal recognition particle-docking protein FtsY [Gemmatimonadota bacterium]